MLGETSTFLELANRRAGLALWRQSGYVARYGFPSFWGASCRILSRSLAANLEEKQMMTVHGPDRPVLLCWHEGQVFALDNRCPHMGFPRRQIPSLHISRSNISSFRLVSICAMKTATITTAGIAFCSVFITAMTVLADSVVGPHSFAL